MHPRRTHAFLGWTTAASVAVLATAYAAGNQAPALAGNDIAIASDTCTTARLGTDVPVEKIGEPVRRVTLAAPAWTAETATNPAYCRVEGVIEPVDTNTTARPINFAVALPAVGLEDRPHVGLERDRFGGVGQRRQRQQTDEAQHSSHGGQTRGRTNRRAGKAGVTSRL